MGLGLANPNPNSNLRLARAVLEQVREAREQRLEERDDVLAQMLAEGL